MAIFVCGLLFYANGVAFNLISAPIFVNDIIAYATLLVAVTLTVITLTIVIRDKRKGLFVKTQKSNVDSVVELDQVSDTVSSPAIAQTSADRDESDVAVIETTKVPDETPAPIAPRAKVFSKRTLFVIILAFTVGLLFFANAVGFGLISLPQYFIYAAVAGAVALAAVAVTLVFGEKIKVLGHIIKSILSEPQVINEVKEPDEAPDIAPAPVIAQTSTIKVDPYTEMLRQFSVQKTTSKLDADTIELEKQLPKKPVIPPTKVICPACRKEFNLPIYEKDFIVDFGSPKQSSLIEPCPYCRTPIHLKRKGDQEDIWKD